MADVSSSAAKEHVLKGAKEIQRVSGDAVTAARDAAHLFLQRVGAIAADSAHQAGRKTIMDTDVAVAVRALNLGGSPAPTSQPTGDAPQA